MDESIKRKLKKAGEALKGRRTLLLLLLLGLVLLLLPVGGGEEKDAPATVTPAEAAARPEAELEARLEEILSRIEGAGQVKVLLTLCDDGERILARDTRTTSDAGGRSESESSALTVSGGGGKSGEVEVSYRYPVYRGAVVCAEGAGSAAVRLELTEAVKAVTGLGTESVKIVKMGATP